MANPTDGTMGNECPINHFCIQGAGIAIQCLDG